MSKTQAPFRLVLDVWPMPNRSKSPNLSYSLELPQNIASPMEAIATATISVRSIISGLINPNTNIPINRGLRDVLDHHQVLFLQALPTNCWRKTNWSSYRNEKIDKATSFMPHFWISRDSYRNTAIWNSVKDLIGRTIDALVGEFGDPQHGSEGSNRPPGYGIW